MQKVNPVAQSVLRALLAALVVQAAYWLLFDPIFHRNKLPQSMVEVTSVEWARLDGYSEADWERARFETRTLPVAECCEEGYRGIKFDFSLDRQPDRPLGLITRMGADNFTIRMNGSTLYSEGRLDSANVTYHGSVRRVHPIPEGVARAGRNQIEIVLARDAGTPYFDFLPPTIGDYRVLSKARESEYFTLNTLATANLAMGMILTFLLVVVMLRGGNSPVIRWFLAIVAAWTGQLIYFEWLDPPLHGIARMNYFYACVTALPLAWLNLANHWSGRPVPLLGRATTLAWLGLTALNSAILSLGLWAKIDTVDLLSMGWGLVLTIGAVILLIRGVLRNFEQSHWETAIFALCLLLIGIDALSALTGLSIKKYADNAMPFMIVGLVAAFLAQNVRLFQSTASLNALLKSELTQRTAELEAVHESEKAMVRSQAHQHERQRIMRDMHDGLGSQLMSMLLMARRGQSEPAAVAEGLQSVIDEMRLMIDSMDSVGESLATALAIFRERISSRVEAAGKRLVWKDLSGGVLPDYGPRDVLQVFRVMQEAVTNALKHSSGDTVTVQLEPSPDPSFALRITLADNGTGLGATNPRGRGLANMIGRTETLGGRCIVAAMPPGVAVTLDLPARDRREGSAA